MKSHDQLMTLSGIVDRDGVLWAFDLNGDPRQVEPITGPEASPDFRNLRNASLLMYVTIVEVQTAIERLTEWLETINGEPAVEGLLRLQASMYVTRRCAIEGIEKVAKERK